MNSSFLFAQPVWVNPSKPHVLNALILNVLIRRLIFIAALIGLPITQAALPTILSEALKKNGIPESAISIVIEPLSANSTNSTKKDIRPIVFKKVVHLDKTMRQPASILKLVTTGAALELLGPNHQWRTSLWVDAMPTKQGNASGVLTGALYIKGGGDPLLNFERFAFMLRRAKMAGIEHIRGPLVIDDALFAPTLESAEDFDGEPLRPYNAIPSALIPSFASVRISLSEGEGQSDLALIKLDPELPTITLQNRVTLIPSKSPKDCSTPLQNWSASLEQGVLKISGTLKRGCGVHSKWLHVVNSREMTVRLFAQLWREMGGQWSGQVRYGKTPSTAQFFMDEPSHSLAHIVMDTNKFSNNLMARMILLSMGSQQHNLHHASNTVTPKDDNANESIAIQRRESTESTAEESEEDAINNDEALTGLTVKDGERAVIAWMQQHGINTDAVVIDNGSGLSRTAMINARQLANVLKTMADSPYAPEFIASLPMAGIDGTLKSRLKNMPNSRIRLKTGYLHNVSSLAGFVRDKAGMDFVVVIMTNHANAKRARAVEEALIKWLAY